VLTAALLKCPPRAKPTTATIATAALIEAAAMKEKLRYRLLSLRRCCLTAREFQSSS
jgi:hypothetical protein